MAATMLCSCLKRQISILRSNSVCVNSVRWSRYSPLYIDPIFRKEEQDELEREERSKELAYVPVKTAPNNVNTSVFYDSLLEYFCNVIMEGGRKKLSKELMSKTFELIKRNQLEKYFSADEESRSSIECNPLKILHNAVENCSPVIILSKVKRGGITYQVPTPITVKRGRFIAVKWLMEAAIDKEQTVHFPTQMAKELVDASRNTGRVVKRKQDLHRNCEANKAFAHYRWG